MRRGRKSQPICGFLNAFTVEGGPSFGADRNVPFNGVFNAGIRFVSHWAEEAIDPLISSIPKGDVNRRQAGEASGDGHRVQT